MSSKTIQNQFEITLIIMSYYIQWNYEIVRYVYYKHI
jgi:hypothetical protein